MPTRTGIGFQRSNITSQGAEGNLTASVDVPLDSTRAGAVIRLLENPPDVKTCPDEAIRLWS